MARALDYSYFAEVHPRARRATLFLSALLVVSTGCRGRRACQELWTKARACEGLPQAAVEGLITRCEADSVKFEVARRTLECGKTCTELDACRERIQAEVFVEMLDTRLAPLAAAENWGEVVLTCRLAEGRASDDDLAELHQRCAPYRRQVYDAWTALYTKARDAPTRAGEVEVRKSDYLRLAEKVGPDAHAAARRLVLEHHGRSELDALRAKLGKQPAKGQAQRFGECTKLLEEIAEIDSDWGRDLTKSAARLCFVEVGHAVLEVDAPQCTTRVAGLVGGVEVYGLASELDDPRLAEVRDAGPCPSPEPQSP